jgi:hypothetical protein
MGVSADGSELAVDVAEAKKGPTFGVYVINTKTGSHAIWNSNVLPGRVVFHPTDLSFASSGHELAIFGFDTCATGVGSHCKGDPGEEMRAVSPAAKGGKLSSGRRIFTQAQLGIEKVGYINDAFMSPDGGTVVINFGGHASGQARVVQLSAATGKILRTLFKPGRFGNVGYLFGTDPSGRFVLYYGLDLANGQQRERNGWIDHGRLSLLKPQSTYIQTEAW